MATPIRDRLAEALIAGDTDSIPALRAGAFAEATTSQVQSDVNRAVADVVYQRLQELWKPFAPRAYKQVADEFDVVAKLFHSALAVYDPEPNAEQAITADEPSRAAWVDAPRHALELDRVAGILRTAAEPCGQSVKDEGVKVALVIDANGAHRRRIWEAWRCKDGRTRRWGALVGTGAVIRAAAIDDLTPYRQCKPLEYKIEQRGGLSISVEHDPEDAEAQSQRRSA